MVELTLNLTSWLLRVPSAYKRPPGGLKVTPRYCCLPGPRLSPFMLFHSLMQTGAANHPVSANGALGLFITQSCQAQLSSVGGALSPQWGVRYGVTTPVNSESHWIIWLLKQHTGPSRTERPQLLTLSSSLSTLTLLPTLKPTLFPPSSPLPFPVLHPPPLVGDGSKLVL